MIDAVRGVLRVRKWPRKRGKPRSAKQAFWVDWFIQANLLAKYADGMSQVRAKEMTKGSGLYPRDVLLMAMRGRLYSWVDQDGWKWYPMAAIGDISEALDVLAQTVGSVLVRAVDRWRAPPAGNFNDVLTYKGDAAPPEWQAVPSPVASFGGALVGSDANQNIVTDTWVPVTFQTEVYDTDALHDPAVNPTRLTIPAGWTKVRVTAGLAWQSSTAGVRWIGLWKNGVFFPGGAMRNYKPVGVANVATATPALEVEPGDYFELVARTSGAGTKYVAGPHDTTYFAVERVT